MHTHTHTTHKKETETEGIFVLYCGSDGQT